LEKDFQNKLYLNFYFQFVEWSSPNSIVTPTTGTSFTAYVKAVYANDPYGYDKDRATDQPIIKVVYVGSAAPEVTSIQYSTVSYYICIVEWTVS
jgi:hypothetical protein